MSVKVRIVGGPSPKDVSIEIDGQPAKSVSGIRFEGDVTRPLSLTLVQYAEMDVEVDVEAVGEEHLCVLRAPEYDDSRVIKAWREKSRGTGPTLRAAAMAAVQALPGEVS